MTLTFPLVAIVLLGISLFGLIRGNTLNRVLCGAVALFLLASLLFPFPKPKAIERARAISCANNLRLIAYAIQSYRDNNNEFPSSILDVVSDITDPEFFVCRSTGRTPGTLNTVYQWTDYTIMLPPNTNDILAYCPPDHHKGQLGVLVSTDGTVSILPPELFEKRIGKQEKEHQQSPAPY